MWWYKINFIYKKVCDPTCFSCEILLTNCTICKATSNYALTNGVCSCNLGYFMN
jgi:hypothetical protein